MSSKETKRYIECKVTSLVYDMVSFMAITWCILTYEEKKSIRNTNTVLCLL